MLSPWKTIIFIQTKWDADEVSIFLINYIADEAKVKIKFIFIRKNYHACHN